MDVFEERTVTSEEQATASGDENLVKKNYLFMLEKLGITPKQFREDTKMPSSTERRIRNGKAGTISDSTIKDIVEYYNEHGGELKPQFVDVAMFKNVDLTVYKSTEWTYKQVEGEYIGLYLSRRGIGKAKAMILSIRSSKNGRLEAWAVDVVHDHTKANELITTILRKSTLEQAKQTHKEMADKKYGLLRGSRFLYGEVSGRSNMLLIHLRDGSETYEVTISVSLKSYLEAYRGPRGGYPCRGGAAHMTVYDHTGWPYSMVIGFLRRDHWSPELMKMENIVDTLERMDGYQKKKNMLCLQHDIDALFYESFMDAYRQHEDNEKNKGSTTSNESESCEETTGTGKGKTKTSAKAKK